MRIDDLDFDIHSMSEADYKRIGMASLSGDEIDTLETSKQVVFTSIRNDIDNYHNILAMAPACWFSSEDEFKARLKSDLSSYIKEAVERAYIDNIRKVGKIMDYMGTVSFENYVPWNLFGPSDGDDIDTDLPDEVQAELYRAVNSAVITSEILDDMTYSKLSEVIDNSEINLGVMYVRTSSTEDIPTFPIETSNENIKESFIIRIILDKVYREIGYEEYSFDIDNLYKKYLLNE